MSKESVIKRILNYISDDFRDDKNLMSLTLVGSHSDLNKKLEKFNDLDLVFVFRDITKKEIDKLNSMASEINNNFSTKDIGITHTLKIGPIKIQSDKKKTIMLHLLVYSFKGYKEFESELTRFSFQRFKPLLGIPLKKISYTKKIKKKDLFNTADGIPAMRKWIGQRVSEYLESSGNGVKLGSQFPSDKLYLEIIFYSVLNLSLNMLRLKGEYLGINIEMCEKFANTFKIGLNYLPKRILVAKNKLRKGYKFSSKEIKNFRELALRFIDECEDVLGRNN